MTITTTREADGRAICRAIAGLSGDADAQDYARHYGTDSTLNMYASMADHLFRAVENPRASIGLDYGCHYGLSTFYFQRQTKGAVWGCDTFAEKIRIAEGWRGALYSDLPLRFIVSRPDSVPLHARSIDWIVLNAVLYCIHPDYWQATFAELARLLKPGGWIFVADSNNPYCSAALDRLRAIHWRDEIGDGSLTEPRGRFVKQREAVIAKLAPDIGSDLAYKIACGTCYLYGSKLKQALTDFLATGHLPASRFDAECMRSPCHPESGFCEGNVTDPFVIQRALLDVGIETTLCPGPVFVDPDNVALENFLYSSQGFYLIGTKLKDHD